MTDRSARVIDPQGLQEVLRDLLRLAVVGDHVRWVLSGEGSSDFAKWLSEAVSQWRDWAEKLAKYMTKLDIAPDGRVKTLARDATRQWVPVGWLTTAEARGLLLPRLDELIKWTEEQRSTAIGSDDTSPLAEVESGLRTQMCGLGAR